jgi:hypothetical protein
MNMIHRIKWECRRHLVYPVNPVSKTTFIEYLFALRLRWRFEFRLFSPLCVSRGSARDFSSYKILGVPYIRFVNWTRVTVHLFSTKRRRIWMWNTGFNHWQTGSAKQFLPGGELGCRINSKQAKCRFDCGHIFDRYLILVKSKWSRIFRCPNSFENRSYDNAKKRPATGQPMKSSFKIQPQVKSTAAEGFFGKINQWLISVKWADLLRVAPTLHPDLVGDQ